MNRPLSLAIHDFLLPWAELAWPVDWPSRFGRSAPLVLEAGFGNGDFLLDLARRTPDRDFVGIEISWGSIQRLLRRVEGAGLTNVRVIQGDAAFLLPRLFPPGSLTEIIANFSDPWRKSRHHRRRLIQPAFIQDVSARLRRDGQITIATDHAEYAEWIARVLETQTAMIPAGPEPRVAQLPGRFVTKYEQRARDHGTPINFFVWKPAQAGEDAPAAETGAGEPMLNRDTVTDEDLSMPNVTFEGTVSGETLWGAEPATFTETHRDVDIVIKLGGVFRSESGDERWISAVVKEGPLTQQFALMLSRRPDSRWLLKLAPVGSPRPTWGVKRAVWHAARRLLDHQPELRPLASTVGTLPGVD